MKLSYLAVAVVLVLVALLARSQFVLVATRDAVRIEEEKLATTRDELSRVTRKKEEGEVAIRAGNIERDRLVNETTQLEESYERLEGRVSELMSYLRERGIRDERVEFLMDSVQETLELRRRENDVNGKQPSCPSLLGVEEATVAGTVPIATILAIAGGEPAFDLAILRGLESARWRATIEELEMLRPPADRLVALSAGEALVEARHLRGGLRFKLAQVLNEEGFLRSALEDLTWVADAEPGTRRGFDAYRVATLIAGLLEGADPVAAKVSFACDPSRIATASHRRNHCAHLLFEEAEQLRKRNDNDNALAAARRAASLVDVDAYGTEDGEGRERLLRFQQRLVDWIRKAERR